MIKEGIHINAIYQHYKGGFYKVLDVVYDHETAKPYVIYSKCDENGIYKSIRGVDGLDGEGIVKQPFSRSVKDFEQIIQGMSSLNSSLQSVEIDIEVPRFKFIKQL